MKQEITKTERTKNNQRIDNTMTTERKQRVIALIAKLEECKTECDDLSYCEEMQRDNLIDNRSNIAAEECNQNCERFTDTFYWIEEAIQALKEVDK
jgi:hypothetical protein